MRLILEILRYIEYSLCQIWVVYMQFLRCCSNKRLFLVIYLAQVLLNFFGECMPTAIEASLNNMNGI